MFLKGEIINVRYNDKTNSDEFTNLKWIKRLIYSFFFFIGGWLFNFIFDIQFALGVAAGWLMREGYDNIARALLDLLR